MEFKGTKGKWILDSDDMLTIRAINTDGRIFITKANTLEYYEKGYKFSIAKAMAKKDNIEVERLRKELFQFDAEQFANARLISKAPEMLEKLKEGIEILDVKCTDGCVNKTWIDFQNGNGEDIGIEIDKFIKESKQLIKEATEL